MSYHLIRVAVYLIVFAACFWALSGLDMAKVLRQGQVLKAQVLLFLLAAALAYPIGCLLLILMNIGAE